MTIKRYTAGVLRHFAVQHRETPPQKAYDVLSRPRSTAKAPLYRNLATGPTVHTSVHGILTTQAGYYRSMV